MAIKYQKGDNCIGVLAIKEMLIYLHSVGAIAQKVDENGIYGEGTVIAVKQAQKLAGLSQTGTANETTIKAIKKLFDAEISKRVPDVSVIGDVNGDGKVNMKDVVELQKEIAGLK